MTYGIPVCFSNPKKYCVVFSPFSALNTLNEFVYVCSCLLPIVYFVTMYVCLSVCMSVCSRHTGHSCGPNWLKFGMKTREVKSEAPPTFRGLGQRSRS